MSFMKCQYTNCNRVAALPPNSARAMNMGAWEKANKGWIWIPDDYCETSFLCPEHAKHLLDLMEVALLYVKEGAINPIIRKLIEERKHDQIS